MVLVVRQAGDGGGINALLLEELQQTAQSFQAISLFCLRLDVRLKSSLKRDE
jgi:hypothetical protein